jgi:hypothetical protein
MTGHEGQSGVMLPYVCRACGGHVGGVPAIAGRKGNLCDDCAGFPFPVPFSAVPDTGDGAPAYMSERKFGQWESERQAELAFDRYAASC